MTETLLPTVLSASSLWSRYGFGDGFPFDFEDRGPAFDDEPLTPLQQAIALLSMDRRADLVEVLVRRHLLPEITRVTGDEPVIVRIGTHHNQVRDQRYGRGSSAMPEAWDDIEVTVTPDQVAEALAEMRAHTPQPPLPPVNG